MTLSVDVVAGALSVAPFISCRLSKLQTQAWDAIKRVLMWGVWRGINEVIFSDKKNNSSTWLSLFKCCHIYLKSLVSFCSLLDGMDRQPVGINCKLLKKIILPMATGSCDSDCCFKVLQVGFRWSWYCKGVEVVFSFMVHNLYSLWSSDNFASSSKGSKIAHISLPLCSQKLSYHEIMFS